MVREILAMHGGNPVRETYLPYGQQQIDEHDIQAVVDILKGDFLTTGPTIQQFEKSIAKYVGAKYAVSFSNGTAALHAACYA
ncbi:UDP-4-amino-4,6-dideoxy-N-acetyl-beta-L-altrosamine transaminase, partial [Bacillus toyonensis]